ncbi:hypothetical protein [Streptomyces sp.]|uniref:hypothetical protein n=1 Tax=Streptomyces sp. TaxID=1931 RepID=UPI002F41A223
MWWIVVLAAAYLLTGTFAVRFRRAHRRLLDAPVTPRPPEEELTLYAVAFLSLYRRRVADTALAAMLLAGRLAARDKANSRRRAVGQGRR